MDVTNHLVIMKKFEDINTDEKINHLKNRFDQLEETVNFLNQKINKTAITLRYHKHRDGHVVVSVND